MIRVSVKDTPIDTYIDGYCLRCNRKRTVCDALRAITGKRCIETANLTIDVTIEKDAQ